MSHDEPFGALNRGLAEKHDELLSALARGLAEKPTATMDDLAEAAGVSRATLFRRVPSRQALVVELSERAADAYIAAVEAADLEEGSAEQALRRLLAGMTALAPSHGLLVLQPLSGLAEEQLLARVSDADVQIKALVRRGQRSGEFRADLSPEWVLTAATWLVVGAADGLRLGVLAPRDIERLVTETLVCAMVESDGRP